MGQTQVMLSSGGLQNTHKQLLHLDVLQNAASDKFSNCLASSVACVVIQALEKTDFKDGSSTEKSAVSFRSYVNHDHA